MTPTQIKYGLITLAFIGWTTGVYFYASGHEARIWQTLIAEQKAEAEKVLREANERTAQENERNAQIARDTDSMYQDLINAAYAGRDDFANRLHIARRGQSCGGVVPGQASTAVVSQEPAPSGDPGPSGIDPALSLRDAVVSLQVYARACHLWAVSVGR